MKVFLGGTVNDSKWRTPVKEQLAIDYFDPVVDEWDDAAYERELSERRYCNYVLYVLTPKMTGFYAVAEVTDDSYQRPDRTIYCYLPEDDGDKMSPQLIEEFEKLGEVVVENGGVWLKNLEEVVSFLNSSGAKKKTEDKIEFNDAFISFGRQESQRFTVNLVNRLNDKELDVFADLSDIPLIVENQDYVYMKILRADNFIYVISPNAVRSEHCKKELEFAIKFNKRIIPIVHHRLGKDIRYLDDIVSKKNILELERKNSDSYLPELIDQICEVIDTDKVYVRSHSEYLFKARNWDFGGRLQADLLFGEERKRAILWMKKKSHSLVPLQIQVSYIEASKKLSVFMIPLLWLHQRMKWITHVKGFDQAAMFLSLLGPIAMMDQVRKLIFSDAPGRYEAVSLTMWILFFTIQFSLILVGIKTKDLRLFLSMIVANIVSATVIVLVLMNR
ncbi:MAG: hypothetical protein ACI857_001785 [Arenicella sp.]|jgi:hypothetical protein